MSSRIKVQIPVPVPQDYVCRKLQDKESILVVASSHTKAKQSICLLLPGTALELTSTF